MNIAITMAAPASAVINHVGFLSLFTLGVLPLLKERLLIHYFLRVLQFQKEDGGGEEQKSGCGYKSKALVNYGNWWVKRVHRVWNPRLLITFPGLDGHRCEVETVMWLVAAGNWQKNWSKVTWGGEYNVEASSEFGDERAERRSESWRDSQVCSGIIQTSLSSSVSALWWSRSWNPIQNLSSYGSKHRELSSGSTFYLLSPKS